MTSAVVLAFVFQGYLVPGLTSNYRPPQDYVYIAYALILLVALVSGMMISDLGRVVGALFVSLALSATIEYTILTLPSTVGSVGPQVLFEVGLAPLSDMAITIVFYSLFPLVLMLSLAGSMVGAMLGEAYLD
jgi:hypothetical protein